MSKTGEPTILHHLFSGIKGYNRDMSKTYQSILKFCSSDQAGFRLEAINHFNQYGLKSTQSAFKVSRASIYRWKRKLIQSEGQLKSLVAVSTKPKRTRTMKTDCRIIAFLREQRQTHYRLGKSKLKVLLDEYCLGLGIDSVSESTIGKIIKRHNLFFQRVGRSYHNPNSGWAKAKVKRKPRVRYSPKASTFGYVEIDTIVKFYLNTKVYVYNAVDIKLRWQFSLAFRSASSQNTVKFFKLLSLVYPIKSGIKTIQTDNGAEYLGHFDQHLRKKKIKHLFIYPRCPRINGHVERANRTLQEEFIDQNLDLAVTDLTEFNGKLIDYLIWYNQTRPHWSLNNISPLNYLLKTMPESQMYVTHTRFRIFYVSMLK